MFLCCTNKNARLQEIKDDHVIYFKIYVIK